MKKILNYPKENGLIKKTEIAFTDSLKKEFVKYKKASATFNNLSSSHKKEYIEWINDAKD